MLEIDENLIGMKKIDEIYGILISFNFKTEEYIIQNR